MIKRSLLALAFVCLPMLANANVISLEYTGHITTLLGDSQGYSIGDAVGGKLAIDLSKATYVALDTPNTAKYQAPSSEDLIGNAAGGDSQGWDFVDVYNDSHVNWLGEHEDFFQISDALPSALPGSVDNLQITLTLKGFDWLTDLTLSNVNIDTNDLNTLGWSFGAFNQFVSGVDSSGNYFFNSNAAIFSLDSIKLVSAEVPEPSSIALIFIGGFALFLRRRRA